MKRMLSQLNITATILFFITLTMTFLYPEILKALYLSSTEAQAILMTLISFILLLSFLQSHMSLTWRIFCLIGSFLVLMEVILMLGAWHRIIMK